MTAYAIGHLRNVAMGSELVAYLERIDATLAPYGARFVIHGGRPEVLEGTWTGDLIVIAFPNLESARDWYHSPAYQAIRPLRTRNADGEILLLAGVDPDHRATDVLEGPPHTSQPHRREAPPIGGGQR